MDADGAAGRDLLDERQIARLLGDVSDRSLFHELLQVFEDESTYLVNELKKAYRIGDGKRMCFLAHTLRGSSLSMGGKALSHRLQELETLVQAGRAVESELELVVTDWKETLAALRQY